MTGIKREESVLNQQERQLQEKIVGDSRQILQRITENRGIVNRIFHKIRSVFYAGPRREVYHDWLFAFSFYYRIIKSYSDSGEKEISVEEKSTLATVLAYLILAKSERDFACAWSYVNLAITHLSLIVEESDLASFTHFLKSDPPNSLLDKKKGPDQQLDRQQIHAGLLIESHRWNEKNCQTSFKLSLLKSVGVWLFLSLATTILIAEYISSYFQPAVLFRDQYVMIAVLGFFGGGLSAFFTARKAVINLTNSALVRLLTILRMLLGAAGSFVVYVILQWQPLTEISQALSRNHAAYITIGIVAGFSERLFIDSLARISGDLGENEAR